MALTDKRVNQQQKVVVFVGGVGGAKLAYGLYHTLPPENLTVIVNVADDFWHYGLRICPDADTIMYTLAGVVDPVNGWGINGDTTATLEMMRRYGEDAWFRLGDQDIATHLLRTQRLHAGERLTQVMQHLTQQLGITCTVLPATDDPIATILHTVDSGDLEFQPYFVKHRWQPQVRAMTYRGIESATVSPEVAAALAAADVILFAPSNPWLSIEPILSIPTMRERLIARDVPRWAVTPIVAGKAIKGPAAKIMQELGYEVSPQTVARFYGEVINGFVADTQDELTDFSGIYTTRLNTLMNNHDDKVRLSREILDALSLNALQEQEA